MPSGDMPAITRKAEREHVDDILPGCRRRRFSQVYTTRRHIFDIVAFPACFLPFCPPANRMIHSAARCQPVTMHARCPCTPAPVAEQREKSEDSRRADRGEAYSPMYVKQNDIDMYHVPRFLIVLLRHHLHLYRSFLPSPYHAAMPHHAFHASPCTMYFCTPAMPSCSSVIHHAPMPCSRRHASPFLIFFTRLHVPCTPCTVVHAPPSPIIH